MTPHDHVTVELLTSVRRELDAKIKLSRAEVDGAVGTLSAEVRATREAQVHEWADLRGALDALSQSVGALTALVEAQEGKVAIDEALDAFKTSIGRRLAGTISLTALVAGAVVAVAAFIT